MGTALLESEEGIRNFIYSRNIWKIEDGLTEIFYIMSAGDQVITQIKEIKERWLE